MSRVRKDAVIVGYELRMKNEDGDLISYDCHKNHKPKSEDYVIERFLTREDLDMDSENKVMCDFCGEEI